jgi:hypothetical protein
MATRPSNSRIQNVFNPGIDKRIPAGFVDQVTDKKTGNLIGFMKDGKFYNLGEKVPKAVKPKQAKKTGRTLSDISSELDTAQREAGAAYLAINAYEPGSTEYAASKKAYDAANANVNTLKSEIEYYQRNTDLQKVNVDIKKKNAELQRAKDLGEDTKEINKDLVDFNRKKSENEKVIADLKPKVVKQEPVDGKDKPPLGLPGYTPPATGGTPSTPSTSSAGGAGGAGGPKVPKKTKGQLQEEALNVAAEQDFALPETIFKNVPSLNALLKRYVDEKWEPSKLRKAIRDDVWFKQNSKEIKARYVQLYNYRDLVATGQATGSTDYEKQIATLTRQLENKAREIGSAAASDPDALRRTAENMYLTNQGIEDSMTIDFLASSIRPVAGMIGGKVTEGYSGEALANYKTLVQKARDNGFQVSDILPGGANEQQVLAGIASGKIDINRVAQDARKLAAQGQPQYVRDLLAQGYDLAQVFKPYRQTMANILEVGDPDQIDLNDPLLRSAITDKGDMNLYDFKKALRQDNRWQYTEQAKADVSTAALQVLRDFGFQG